MRDRSAEADACVPSVSCASAARSGSRGHKMRPSQVTGNAHSAHQLPHSTTPATQIGTSSSALLDTLTFTGNPSVSPDSASLALRPPAILPRCSTMTASSHPDLLAGFLIPCLVNVKARSFTQSYGVKDAHFPDRIVHQAIAVSTEGEVQEVIEAADKAAQLWKRTSVLERRRMFLKAATSLAERILE